MYIMQIMNGYECNGTDIFMRWKIKCSIERGEAKLNGTFNLSPNENICTIARMKNIHYLFHIISKNICYHLERLNNINILQNAILFRSRCFRSKVTAVVYSTLNCTIQWLYSTVTSQFVEWSDILYHVTVYLPIKWQQSTLVLYKSNYAVSIVFNHI